MSWLLLSVLLAQGGAGDIDLAPRTVKEFEAFMDVAGRQMSARASGSQPFLWSASNPDRLAQLKARGVLVSPTNHEPATEIHHGLVHDWTGAIFVPGAKAAHALRILQDIDSHKRIYAPDTVDSRLISRDGGGGFTSSMRTVKKRVITVALDYEFSTAYRELKPGRWQGAVRSTRILEVDNLGQPDERRKPEGTGFGFLWRLNSWWHVEEIEGGVVMELRSVSLTRGVPGLLSWAIKPLVTSLPKETLEITLGKTRSAVLGHARQSPGP
ncbi:MAG: hypothetical protein C0504_10855 [Candidatus Solibacter sp.]|nr:hypothetical protein [Candidatus Solibacter sp.]